MKISTTEIKMLIKECVSSYGMYTATDFGNYIRSNSGKDFTRGQISGAIAQLVDANEIVRIGRGLYSKDDKSISDKNIASNSEAENLFQKEIYDTLCIVEKDLAKVTGSVNIWELDGKNFEIVAKIRELKKSIDEIKSQCK
jgi:Ulp1 family protease